MRSSGLRSETPTIRKMSYRLSPAGASCRKASAALRGRFRPARRLYASALFVSHCRGTAAKTDGKGVCP